MSLNDSSIELLQAAGQYVDNARAAFEEDARALNQRIADAMFQDPFNTENDNMFEAWKQVSRIGRDLQHMEAALRDLYATSKQLTKPVIAKRTVAQPALRLLPLSAPAHTVTDVEPKKSGPVIRENVPASKGGRKPRNSDSLMKYLKKRLHKKTPTQITLSEMGLGSGLSEGSVHAALHTLLASSSVIRDEARGLTLGSGTGSAT